MRSRFFYIIYSSAIYLVLVPPAKPEVQLAQVETKNTIRTGNKNTSHVKPENWLAEIPDTTELQQLALSPKIREQKSNAFYDSLRNKAYRNGWFTRNLFKYLYRPCPENSGISANQKSESPFLEFSGKIIGSIYVDRIGFRRLAPTDSLEMRDVTLEKIGDFLHVSTKPGVIRDYLLFKPGDEVEPLKLAENERILRELPFVDDARLQLIPRCGECDTVDVLVATTDLWTLGMRGKMKDTYSAKISIYEQNLGGWGHAINTTLRLDNSRKFLNGWESSYFVDNIAGLFLSGEVRYAKTPAQNTVELNFQRPFFATSVKYAGGMKLLQTREFFEPGPIDISGEAQTSQYLIQDFWGGHAMRLRDARRELNQVNVIFSGRIRNRVYSIRPAVPVDSLWRFQDFRLALGSISFSRRNYYKSHYILGFGRTEDVPCGFLAEISSGVDWTFPQQRFYSGAKISRGDFLPGGLGYLYGSLGVGGFYFKRKIEEGVLAAQMNYFTNLFFIKNYKIRQFCRMNYTRGFSRLPGEKITINNQSGIRGVESLLFQGTKRLALQMETQVFTPIDFYSFNVAAFGFSDLAWIDHQNNTYLFQETPYWSFGVGLRIRNERLVFNTLQITIGYFPNAPAGISHTSIRFTGEQVMRFTDFEAGSPKVIGFE